MLKTKLYNGIVTRLSARNAVKDAGVGSDMMCFPLLLPSPVSLTTWLLDGQTRDS